MASKSKAKKPGLLGTIFAAAIAVCTVLVIVGLFLSWVQLNKEIKNVETTVGLFKLEGTYGTLSMVFAIITTVFAALLTAYQVTKFLGVKINIPLGVILGILTALMAILTIIFASVLVNDLNATINEAGGGIGGIIAGAADLKYVMGAGAYLLPISGIIAGACGVLNR